MVPTPTVRTIGEPIEAKQRPDTGYQAQFSGPYAVAAACRAAVSGLGLEDFSDARANDADLRDLMSRITVGGSPECDAVFPHQFPAILEVVTHDGRVLVEKVLTDARRARRGRCHVTSSGRSSRTTRPTCSERSGRPT